MVDPAFNEAIYMGVGIAVMYLSVWHHKLKESEDAQKTREALQTYVRTGRKSKAFNTTGRSLIASAERARLRYINEQRRARENAAIDAGFQAVCECPKCQTIALHWLTGNQAGRQCISCGCTWHVPN